MNRKERQDALGYDQDFTSQLGSSFLMWLNPVFLMRKKQAECQHMGTEGWRLGMYTRLGKIKNKDVFMGNDSIIYKTKATRK